MNSIAPGVYPDLTNEAYHSDPAISRSGIMNFLDSPFKYWAQYINHLKPIKEQTDAMIFGSAFHAYMLEEKTFVKNYAVEPEKVLLKDVGREIYDRYKNNLERLIESGKTLISKETYRTFQQMAYQLEQHKEAKALIEDAVYESSYFWEDEHTGIMCKARPDILHENMIVDLKTCASASPRAFQSDMANYGNYIQGAMIRDAIGKKIPVINICIEKTYPYQIGIYIIDEAALEEGHNEYKQALLDIKACRERNEWPSYEIQTIGLPTWRRK